MPFSYNIYYRKTWKGMIKSQKRSSWSVLGFAVMHASMAFASLVCGFSLFSFGVLNERNIFKFLDYFPDVILWLMLLEFPEILKKFPVTAVRMCLAFYTVSLLFCMKYGILKDFFFKHFFSWCTRFPFFAVLGSAYKGVVRKFVT